jgi:hypothetical protein
VRRRTDGHEIRNADIGADRIRLLRTAEQLRQRID